MQPKFVTIQGNIGAGKSTLVSNIQKLTSTLSTPLKIVSLQEPIDEWRTIRDKDGVDILTLFYKDQEKYSFPFQMMTYISRLDILKNALINSGANIIISERSLSTDKNIFCKMLHDQGKISDVEFQIYNKWFDSFQKDIPKENVVYLRSSPYVAAKRIEKRSREGENIDFDYLSECHHYHEKWMEEEVSNGDRRVLVLDVDEDMNKNSDKMKIAEQVVSFVLDEGDELQ